MYAVICTSVSVQTSIFLRGDIHIFIYDAADGCALCYHQRLAMFRAKFSEAVDLWNHTRVI
jgi:hypothetical protein